MCLNFLEIQFILEPFTDLVAATPTMQAYPAQVYKRGCFIRILVHWVRC
jgi:hypothetical protein